MKRDRAIEELRALVLANNPQLNAAEIDALTDIEVLERVRDSVILDERGEMVSELEAKQMRELFNRLIRERRDKPNLH